MNVLSLFDGISCGQVAFERIGIKFDGIKNKYFASEIDKNAIKITQKNYPNTIQLGNVFDIDYKNLPKIDIIIGGSPCTYWSIARSSLANHQRETINSGLGWELFSQYKKALDIIKPRFFLYENNFSISQNIKEEITKSLGVEYVVLNSNLVSAQNRKRCYWTNISIAEITDKKISFQDIKEQNYEILKEYKVKLTPSRIRMWNNGLGRINGAICCDNITHKDKTGTVTSKQDRNYNAGLIEFEDFCRYLTVNELEKLQTLPVNYTLCDGVSLLQRQLAIGNGWTVDIIAHILSGIPKDERQCLEE